MPSQEPCSSRTVTYYVAYTFAKSLLYPVEYFSKLGLQTHILVPRGMIGRQLTVCRLVPVFLEV
jgi:hypothetical protein